ncbi:MAG: bifunctional (p)ppGpp synthetase/guanosine-3',5'-bis(diphosphate) 3'-pyrophosphohydrolase [Acidobacteriota bacterium]|nr:MAG: bifunctional (p)ppGpp synthetase/guanosine-3',5'-bis(diphosphate) 3'-pyrophosphohydrolase [Acidobacteriota bacterium]
MIRYEDLEEKVLSYNSNADVELLRKAYIFSAREHKGQVRKSGEPYLTHPLEVANILAEMKLDVASVSVGLLHDVVEDTLTDLTTIREFFGDGVAHLVGGVTKISKIEFSSREEQQAENFRKLLLAMVDDIRVILVKLADRLHNIRTLGHLSPEKQRRIARETLDIYAPIALRLGMSRIRGELEDLSYSYLDPEGYKNLLSDIEARKKDSENLIKSIVGVLEKVLDEQGIQARIESRIKRVYSVAQKMKRQKIGLNQVYDFFAIRILVDSVRDCYSVLGIVNNQWNPVPGRIKDFIAMPRNNMYQSLHTTVVGEDGQPFEIQIRTHEMHRVAEEGIAAHWKYKEGKLTEGKDDKRFLWLRHLLEWQREVKDPHQFLSNLKIDLYPDEVYIFTPKGEVFTLPRGATSLDFAYYVHTEVGHKCVGAKVNRRIVPLKYILNNGEIVEILTSSDAKPSRDWLKIVKTSRARSAIRRWLNQRQKEEALELGRKLLDKAFRKHKRTLKKYEEKLSDITGQLGVSSAEEVIAGIGYGKFSAKQVVELVVPELAQAKEAGGSESKLGSMVRRVLRRSDSPIQVKGHDDLLVYRARCCNPIRGEEVVGYITVGRGISVHSVNCSNLENLLVNPDRRVEVRWTDEDGDGARYPVRLQIETEDRTGVLADITTTVSSIKTNILDARARVIDGHYGLVELTVEVGDTKQLDKIVNCIKKIGGVRDVGRAKPSARKSRR